LETTGMQISFIENPIVEIKNYTPTSKVTDREPTLHHKVYL
jgi:hypothetical protein